MALPTHSDGIAMAMLRQSQTSESDAKQIKDLFASVPEANDPAMGKTRSKTPKTYSPDFLDFYAAYPRKADKFKAFTSWERLSAEDKALALAGVAAYIRSREGEDPKYTKMPSTWLNNRCWEDVLDAPVAKDGW